MVSYAVQGISPFLLLFQAALRFCFGCCRCGRPGALFPVLSHYFGMSVGIKIPVAYCCRRACVSGLGLLVCVGVRW